MDHFGHHPYVNTRFRVEVDGMRSTGATEVILPEARIVGEPGKGCVTQYGNMTIRRGLTDSSEWYDWWDRNRSAKTLQKRNIAVVLINDHGGDAHQWTFLDVSPMAYILSTLNALGSEIVIETLELTVRGFNARFVGASNPKTP